MSRFQKLCIENFQSHVYTEIDFHPGLNVIVGPTDSGKSAILRALGWVLFNVPRGKDFIRKGSRQCQVSLLLADGTEIIRVRNQQSINRYILRKPSESEAVFEGFGSDVPQEILDAHQIQPVKLEGKDIWLQYGTQLENAFLLSETGGMKAKMIGLVSGAHRIDQALKETNRDRKQKQIQQKSLTEQKDSLVERLQPYENLTSLRDRLDQTRARMNVVKRQRSQIEKLQQLARRWKQLQQEKEEWEHRLSQLASVPLLEQRQLKMERQLWKLTQMRFLYQKVQRVGMEKRQCQSQLELTRHLAEAETQVVELSHKRERYLMLAKRKNRLDVLQKQLTSLHSFLQTSQSVDTAQNRLVQVLKQTERMEKMKKKMRSWQRLLVSIQLEQRVLTSTQALPEIVEEIYPHLVEKWKHHHVLQGKATRYQETQKQLFMVQQYVLQQKEQIQMLSIRYAEMLQKHGKCPTCGSLIEDEQLEDLIDEIRGGKEYVAAGREDQGD